jgi:Flp pilus assembly protein TadG
MPISPSHPSNVLAKVVRDFDSLCADQRGNIAVMMAFLLPVMIGGLGRGWILG